MVVWGGATNGFVNGLNTGGKYNPTTNTWIATSTVNAPSGRDFHTATWTGNALYACTVSGTNPGKLTLACVGTGSTLTSAGSTVSFAPPTVQTPILPDLSYSYAQAGTTMAGRLERLSDGSYLVHVTKYSAPGPQSAVVVETGADTTANLQ